MTRTELVAYLDLETHTLDVWLTREWLLPEQRDAEPTFSPTDLARARLIRQLTADMGVNDEGIDVILHLLDQLHGVRRAFADLREGMAPRP